MNFTEKHCFHCDSESESMEEVLEVGTNFFDSYDPGRKSINMVKRDILARAHPDKVFAFDDDAEIDRQFKELQNNPLDEVAMARAKKINRGEVA